MNGWTAADPVEETRVTSDDSGPSRVDPTEPTTISESGKAEPKKSAAVQLVDLALERYTFGCAPEGDLWALPLPHGHVVRLLRGGRSSLRAELAKAYRAETGRVAPQQALAEAVQTLEGEAQDVEPRPVHLRVAEADGAVWVDLGDKSERAVRIAAGGWSVVTEGVPVLFRRTSLTAALPMPEGGGSIAELWPLLNVSENDRPLVLAWLVAALACPSIPHPVLALLDEAGTGKSTATRTLVSLVDPSPVPLRKPPRDGDGWVTAASGSWVVGLDNLSTVPDWLSDTLCRAVTGDGDVRRQLYTDAGLAVFAFRRALIVNGIDLGALRNDLAERVVLVSLDRIAETDRRTETDLDAVRAGAYPRLFGALLDEAAAVQHALPGVRLASSPRMADFARVVKVLDDRSGTSGLDHYREQASRMAEDALGSDVFLTTMTSTVTAEVVETSAKLLDRVTPSTEGWRAPRDWPKNARAVTGILKRNAPALRRSGWTVDDLGADNEQHVTRWKLSPPEKAGKQPSSPSSNSSAQVTRLGETRDTSHHEADEPTSDEGTRNTRDESGQSLDDLPAACSSCGAEMLLQLPGRDTCERCRISEERAS